MQFYKTLSYDEGAHQLTLRLRAELAAGKKVLWLLSGGSAIQAEVTILDSLSEAYTSKLTIALMDERFGTVGHPDSNWQQMVEAGADFSRIQTAMVIVDEQSLADTAASYETNIRRLLAESDIVIGLFGIGSDGHTAGILPNSPATHDTRALVCGYQTPQYDRITLTKTAINQITVGYVFAFGPEKAVPLQKLADGVSDFVDFPAQLIAELPEVYVYNDQQGEIL